MSLPVRLALHSRIKVVWLTDERRWRSYRNHRCKQGSSCSGLRGRIDSRVAQLSAAGNSVLIIEAGIDAKDVPAVYDAERRGQLNGTCNWKYQSYGDNGAPLSWKIDSGVRCCIFLLSSSIFTRFLQKCLGGSSSSMHHFPALRIPSDRVCSQRHGLVSSNEDGD